MHKDESEWLVGLTDESGREDESVDGSEDGAAPCIEGGTDDGQTVDE